MATAAAAVVAKARREVTSHFFSHHAVTAESAIPFEPDRRIVRRQFERLRSSGVIREAEAGKYWIDVAAYDIDASRRRKLLMFVVAFVAAIAAAVATVAVRS